ncbi:hypothetical protein CTAYLR_001489 [Chrysophaeum taylorii]|uniref:FH2 domain-containing protein n=1 Tax=Chrysophaeum taylorii TaxID=2483200 RepID=A0AAD7UDE3_9STRA|nr:hypothetical protein CTAYLR_001489 [Chrysophaeum taylorii]
MEGDIDVYAHTARARRFLSRRSSGKWVRVRAVLKGAKLEFRALAGGDQYIKAIALGETTACSAQKCYGRANCIVVTGFNRSAATKRVFDCSTQDARNKWQAAFKNAIKNKAKSSARERAERQALARSDRAAQRLRQKTRTLESFLLWYEEFAQSMFYHEATINQRRWWAAMDAVARIVFREREETHGYTSLRLIRLQKKLADIDSKKIKEIKRKARRIIKDFVREATSSTQAMAKWGKVLARRAEEAEQEERLTTTSHDSVMNLGRGDTTTITTTMESSPKLPTLLRRERVLAKLTRTLETIRREERHAFVLCDAFRGLWVARCVRALLNAPGGLAAVLAMPQEGGSIRRLLAAALLCRIPLLTTLVLEKLAALALLPGREGRIIALNVLAQVEKNAKWGQALCSDYMMRASPEALRWSRSAPRNPPPFAAIATLLHDAPEHNCCPELRSAVITLFAALCRSEATRSGAQWMQARIFHACRAALNPTTAKTMASLHSWSAGDETTTLDALQRVQRRRSSMGSKRGRTFGEDNLELVVVDVAPSATRAGGANELHPCQPLLALLQPSGEVLEDAKRLFRIQLEHFLDGWDLRELDEADECDSLPIGSAERTEILCDRVRRSALLVGRYVDVDNALHAFGADLEHAALRPIRSVALRTIFDDDPNATSGFSLDLNATINSACKLHGADVAPGAGLLALFDALQRAGALVANPDHHHHHHHHHHHQGIPLKSPMMLSEHGISPTIAKTPPCASGAAIKDNPQLAKYFKMIRMHVPKLAVEAKMAQEGLDPSVLDLNPDEPAPEDEKLKPGEAARDGDDARYAEFAKMLKLHVPRGSLEHKMRAEGLDPKKLLLGEPAVDPAPGDEEAAETLEAAKSRPPPLGCNRVPRHRLRRVYWEVVSSAAETMWEEAEEFLSDEGLEELETIFGTTTERRDDKAAAKKKAEDSGRALVAEALGDKRAFALNLLYGSLRISNDECVAAVASLDPDGSVLVSKLARLGTLYNLVSRKEDLATIELQAVKAGILDESTKTLVPPGATLERLDPLSALVVALVDRARRPRAKVQALWLYATLKDRAADLKTSITNLESIAKAIREATSLRKLLRIVLSITNFVNHGSGRGDNVGVRVSALARLQTTRTTTSKTDAVSCNNLLQFVVRHSGVPGPELRREIPSALSRAVCSGATRATISAGIAQLRAERDDALAERGVLSREATTHAPAVDARRVAVAAAAAARMAHIVADVQEELAGLEAAFATMDAAVDDLLKYYGEPPTGEAISWLRTLDAFVAQYDAEYASQRDHLRRRERREALARKKIARDALLHLQGTSSPTKKQTDDDDDDHSDGRATPLFSCFDRHDDDDGGPDDDDDIRGDITGDIDRHVDDLAPTTLTEERNVICAQCRACTSSTTPGAYTTSKGFIADHPSWYCADCWYDFSYHNPDWKDDFGEETAPIIG